MFCLVADVFAKHGVAQGSLVLEVLTSRRDSTSVDVLFSHLAKRGDIADILVPEPAADAADAEEARATNQKVLDALLETVDSSGAAAGGASMDDGAGLTVSPVLLVLKEVVTGLLVRGMDQALRSSASTGEEDSGDAAGNAAGSLVGVSNSVAQRGVASIEAFLKSVPDGATAEEKARLRAAVEVSVVGNLLPTMALAIATMMPHLPVSVTEALMPAYTRLLQALDQL